MNQVTLSNMTDAELGSMDPEQDQGVYREVFKRFSEGIESIITQYDIGYEDGEDIGFDRGFEGRQKIQDLCSEQADDEALWVKTQVASEAYMQTALRKLHTIIEGY